LTNKEYAAHAAVVGQEAHMLAFLEPEEELVLGRKRDTSSIQPILLHGTVSPSIEQGAAWLKRQRMDPDVTPALKSTPTTAASSAAHETSFLDSSSHSPTTTHYQHLHQHDPATFQNPGWTLLQQAMPPSPSAMGSIYHDAYSSFADAFIPQAASSMIPKQQGGVDDIEPLQLASAAMESAYQHHHIHHGEAGQDPSLDDSVSTSVLDQVDDFPPPSPLHPDQHHGDLAHDRFDD
jgi:hypothetical protein